MSKKPVTQIKAPEDSCNPAVRDRLLKLVTERGIQQGTITKRIAQQLYPKARPGQQLTIGPAKLTVVA